MITLLYHEYVHIRFPSLDRKQLQSLGVGLLLMFSHVALKAQTAQDTISNLQSTKPKTHETIYDHEKVQNEIDEGFSYINKHYKTFEKDMPTYTYRNGQHPKRGYLKNDQHILEVENKIDRKYSIKKIYDMIQDNEFLKNQFTQFIEDNGYIRKPEKEGVKYTQVSEFAVLNNHVLFIYDDNKPLHKISQTYDFHLPQENILSEVFEEDVSQITIPLNIIPLESYLHTHGCHITYYNQHIALIDEDLFHNQKQDWIKEVELNESSHYILSEQYPYLKPTDKIIIEGDSISYLYIDEMFSDATSTDFNIKGQGRRKQGLIRDLIGNYLSTIYHKNDELIPISGDTLISQFIPEHKSDAYCYSTKHIFSIFEHISPEKMKNIIHDIHSKYETLISGLDMTKEEIKPIIDKISLDATHEIFSNFREKEQEAYRVQEIKILQKYKGPLESKNEEKRLFYLEERKERN